MGAEEISRKGISNVEQGLTKVTGINSVEGRGLFVRGLEEIQLFVDQRTGITI